MIAACEILEDYFRLMTGNGMSHVYRTAKNLGVLDAVLESRRITASELAIQLNLKEQPLSLLLKTLTAMHLLRADGESYVPGEVLQLLKGPYGNLSDEYWAHLEEYLKTGEPFQRMDDPAESEAAYVRQASALAWMLRPAAELAAEWLLNLVPNQAENPTILDLGCGSGVWSLALARRLEKPTLHLADWPTVLQIARSFAAESRISEGLHLHPGNFHDLNLPACSINIVLVANVFHLENDEAMHSIFQKMHVVLKPGGRIAVIDVFAGIPAGEQGASLYALGLGLRTVSGRVRTESQFASAMRCAGFTSLDFKPLDVPPFTMGMLTGSKP